MLVALSAIDLAAECVAKAKKPVKLSGALCGRVFNTIAGPEPHTVLILSDQIDVWVAQVRADSKAAFTFPPLPKGTYRMRARGWTISSGNIEITNSNVSACDHPVVVYVGTNYPDCSGGWVSKKWDFRVFPDGPPRK